MKREDKSVMSRQRILEAAFEEFASKGYDGASLNAVWAEKGISKGIIYHHFKDKDEIYPACVAICFDALAAHSADGGLSGFRFLLYDDHHVPDDRRIQNRTATLSAPSMSLIYSLHTDAAVVLRRHRHLSVAAFCRRADHSYLPVAYQTHEINRVTANAAFRRRRIGAASGMISAAPAAIFCRMPSKNIKPNNNNRHFFHRKG